MRIRLRKKKIFKNHVASPEISWKEKNVKGEYRVFKTVKCHRLKMKSKDLIPAPCTGSKKSSRFISVIKFGKCYYRDTKISVLKVKRKEKNNCLNISRQDFTE